jgi:hypothetical protein
MLQFIANSASEVDTPLKLFSRVSVCPYFCLQRKLFEIHYEEWQSIIICSGSFVFTYADIDSFFAFELPG